MSERLDAGVMELVDVTDSKSVGSDTVWVRVPPPAPQNDVDVECTASISPKQKLPYF